MARGGGLLGVNGPSALVKWPPVRPAVRETSGRTRGGCGV